MPENNDLVGKILDGASSQNEETAQETTAQPVEEIKEEVHLNTEDKTIEEPAEVVSEESPKLEITDDLIYGKLSERLGRDITSLDDLVVKEEVVKEVPREYISEFGKKYEEYYKDTGRTPEDFLNLQRDIDSLSKADVIKESLKLQNPDLSREELDYLYSRDYSIDPDEMTESEVRDREIKIKMDYNKGKRALDADKAKYAVPNEDSIASIEARKAETQQQLEERQKNWAADVKKSSAEIKGIDIDLGESLKFTHAIPDDSKKSVSDIASDLTMSKWAERYQRSDGTLDAKQLQKDIYIRDNLDSIISDAVTQAIAKNTESIIKTDKNINFKSDSKPNVKPNLSKQAEEELEILRRRGRI